MVTLLNFKPPAVEPAQAPKQIRIIITVFDNAGHWLKSAEANPVVEIIEATWNNDNLKQSCL